MHPSVQRKSTPNWKPPLPLPINANQREKQQNDLELTLCNITV